MALLEIGDRKFRESVPDWPEPLEFVEGAITYKGDDFARSTGWEETHPKRNQTNMVRPMFHIKDGKVVFAKDIVRLDLRKYWLNDFYIPWLGFEMWSRYCQDGFWREDTNAKPTDPITGEFKEQTIDCGTNLHKLIGEPFWTSKGRFQQLDYLDYYSHYDPEKYNYFLTPQYCIKQVLASISSNEPVAYITDQKRGDIVVPNVCKYPPILPNIYLERFPEIPFTTKYLGEEVTILAYCFQASKVFGLFPDGWRVIEESLVSGIGSAFFDRRVYVDKWVKTPPPTIKGFTLYKDSLFNWQIP